MRNPCLLDPWCLTCLLLCAISFSPSPKSQGKVSPETIPDRGDQQTYARWSPSPPPSSTRHAGPRPTGGTEEPGKHGESRTPWVVEINWVAHLIAIIIMPTVGMWRVHTFSVLQLPGVCEKPLAATAVSLTAMAVKKVNDHTITEKKPVGKNKKKQKTCFIHLYNTCTSCFNIKATHTHDVGSAIINTRDGVN